MSPERWFGLTWSFWGAFALVIALVYAVFWPRPRDLAHATHRPIWVRLVLRWAHAAVWLLLAAFCFGRAGRLPLSNPVAAALAWFALAVYALFLLALFYDKAHLASNKRT